MVVLTWGERLVIVSSSTVVLIRSGLQLLMYPKVHSRAEAEVVYVVEWG